MEQADTIVSEVVNIYIFGFKHFSIKIKSLTSI